LENPREIDISSPPKKNIPPVFQPVFFSPSDPSITFAITCGFAPASWEEKKVIDSQGESYVLVMFIWMFPKTGVPPKWMVKIMENPIKMDDLGGKPTIFGNIHIVFPPPKKKKIRNYIYT